MTVVGIDLFSLWFVNHLAIWDAFQHVKRY